MSSSFDSSSGQELINEFQKVQKMKDQLQIANSQMFQEFTHLRSQNKEISKNLEKCLQEKSKMSDEIKRLNAEKQELTKKIFSFQEIANAIKVDKKSERNNSIHETKKQKKVIKKSDEIKSQLGKAINDNQKLSEKLEEQQYVIDHQSEIQKIIIQNFESFFQQSFNSIEDLIEFIQKQNSSLSSSLKTENPIGQIKLLKQNNKKLKEKLSKVKQDSQSVMTEFSKYKQKEKKEKSFLKNKIKLFETKINEIQQQNNDQNAKNGQCIEAKNSRIQDLENENNLLKQQISGINCALYSIPSSFQYGLGNQHSNDQTISLLQQRLSESTQQAQSMQNEIKELNRTVSYMKKQNEQSSNSLDQKNSEISKLRIERDELEGKYNATFSQIECTKAHTKQLQTELNDVSKKLSLSKAANLNFEKLFNSQQAEIAKLSSDRNDLSSMTHRLKAIVQKEESLIENLLSESKEYKKKYKKIKKACSIKPDSQNDQNAIPMTSWYCQEFDEELCGKISEFASNEAFPASAKLKHVLLTIAKYYQNKINEENKSMIEEKEKQNMIVSTINDFLIPIGQQIGVEKFDFDSLMNPFIISQFQLNMSTLINECNELRQVTANDREILNQISQKLMVANDCIPREIDLMKSHIENLQNDLTNTLSKFKTQKKSLNILKRKYIANSNEQTNLLKQKDASISKLKTKNNDLSYQLKNVQSTIINSTNIQASNETSNEEKIQLANHYQKQIDDLQEKIRAMKANYNSNIQALENLNQRNLNDIKRLENDVVFWKQNSEAIKTAQIQKDREIQQLNIVMEKIEDNSNDRNEAEKETIQKQYETVISSLKDKNNELRNIIEELSSKISKYEAFISKLKNENAQLNSDKDQMIMRFDVQNEEHKRQSLILDQKLKAFELSNDTKTLNTIADLKSQHENENRKIFSFAVRQFHTYCDVSKQIDENAFKDIISRASTELYKLINQDSQIRKLLGITQTESVEQALSSILLTLYHQR